MSMLSHIVILYSCWHKEEANEKEKKKSVQIEKKKKKNQTSSSYNRKRKLDEHHIGGTYCAYLVAHQSYAIELASLLVLV